MSKAKPRRRVFIDRPIQGSLILRVMLIWLVGMLLQVLLVTFFFIVTSSPNDLYQAPQLFWWHLELLVVSSLLVLPLLAYDIVKLSHRWVGPIYRLRTALRALSRGEAVQPISFREGDFWKDLAGDFNAVAERLNDQSESNENRLSVDELEPVSS